MPDLKAAFRRATPGISSNSGASTPRSSSAGSDVEPDNNAEKYLLRVTSGPAYDPSTHRVVDVNGSTATSFESDAMSVQVRVRIKDYHGLPHGSPKTSPYFSDPDHKSSLYSVSFAFVPKKTIPSTDLVWGNDLDHPVRDRLPPGFNTAFGIVKRFIDPGLECDVYADEPWLYGPALSCWFALRIGESGQTTARAKEMETDRGIVVEGADGSGQDVRSQHGIPEGAEKRRKYFIDKQHRQDFSFEAGRLYQGDFHNPYLDFSNYALKLPGFSLGILRYLDDKTHELRYVFKNRATGEVYFVVVITLLFGNQLREALNSEDLD